MKIEFGTVPDSIAYLLLGGNQGDRIGILKKARKLISESVGEILETSMIYETAPWGFKDESKFLNQVIKVSTHLNPGKLLDILLEIEKSLGRMRGSSGYQSRSIDIDILFYNNLVMNEENLIIPHPRIALRRFVLIPLAEIASGLIHPSFRISINELLKDCKDILEVVPYIETKD